MLRWLSVALVCVGCGGNDVNSSEDAHQAYVSLDPAIDQAITLGFAGFNAGTNANIDPQSANGRKSGTITVTGMVDRGSSSNKGMRLNVEFLNYSDDGKIYFSTTPGLLPSMTLTLRNIPNGSLDGVITGDMNMSGDLSGLLTLSLNMTAQLEAVPGQAGQVQRKVGTTVVTGTASSASGTYTINASN